MLLVQRFPAALLLLAFLACTPNISWRPTPAEFHKIEGGYHLLIIELDGHGEFWDRTQLDYTLRTIEEENRKPFGSFVFTFIHGWKNDDSPRNEETGNLRSFKSLLSALAMKQSSLPASQRRAIVGIYLSWRGDSLKGPDLFKNLTFFDRLAAAREVAASPASTEVITAVASKARQNPNSRIILVGHSMGALILEKAITQSFVGAIISTRLAQFALNPNPDYPADLVILVNAAAPALYARSLTEFLSANQVVSYTSIHPDYICSESPAWRPMIISITSESDNATRIMFPIGMILSLGSSGSRYYGKYDSDQKRVVPIHDAEHSQTRFYRHTAGHLPELLTHDLKRDQVEKGACGQKEICPCQAPPVCQGSLAADASICFISGASKFTLNRKQTGEGTYSSPYWIMQAPDSVIHGHGGTFDLHLRELVEGLIEMLTVLPGERLWYLWGCSWIQGMRAFDDSYPGTIRPAERLRAECVPLLNGYPHTQEVVQSLSDSEVVLAMRTLEKTVDSQFHLRKAFIDGAVKHGQVPYLKNLVAANSYSTIRSLFFTWYANDQYLRNLLASVSNQHIKELVDQISETR